MPQLVGLPAASASELTPLQVALRNKGLILGFAVIIAAMVYGALSFVSPTFVAEADVRIDLPQVQLMDANASLLPAQQMTLEALHTEMAVLNSPRLAMNAAHALGLESVRDYQICPKLSFTDKLHGLLGKLRGQAPPTPPACEVSLENAGKVLLGGMSFGTDRSSFIIQISASAADAELAARIANGYAAAFIAWQRDSKNRLAQDADEWLRADLAAMRDKLIAADAEVEAYRQNHHLVGMHGQDPSGQGGSVNTLATQGLEHRNLELSNITAALTEKTTTLAQVQDALRNGEFDAMAPTLNSPVVQNLLSRHDDLATTLAQLRAQHGSSYPAVATAAAALARSEEQIRVEAAKIVRSLAGEVAALKARKAAMAAQVGTLEGQVAGESQDDVKLQELQREAQSERNLYESLFVRFKQVDAERHIDRTNAAVVVEATPPDVPAFPRKRMMVAGAFLASLGIGTGLAFARQMMSSRFRDGEQVEGEIGLPVIGIFPKRGRAPQDLVIDHPLSVEAEAVHSTLIQIVGQPDVGVLAGTANGGMGGNPLGRVALITSALPGEGKSCFCVALGRSAMRSGLSAFILDCDLRRPAIGRLMAEDRRSPVTPGKLPAASAGDPAEMIAELMRHAGVDERTGLRYLSLSDYVTNPHGLLAWPGLPATLKYLRSRYDLVLLDTPPVLAVSDALKLGGLADKVMLMIDWRETSRQAVAAAVRALQRANVAVSGLVMSKVDIRRYARTSGSEGMYVRNYRRYHEAIDSAG